MSDATILGGATVQSTASLELDRNGTIGGGVVVNNLGSLDENDSWTIRGAIFGNSAAELIIAATVHNVIANKDDTLAIQSATVDGNIVSNDGVLGGAIVSSAIHGNVLVNGTSPGLPGLSSAWEIAGPQLSGDDQEIDGNLVLTNNQSQILTFDTHIHQNLICYGNDPPPYTGSTVSQTRSTGSRSASARPRTPRHRARRHRAGRPSAPPASRCISKHR